ncbi:ABC transporter ATP-binding protein [Kocuria coralli]|uniref:ABC transporter ATP-binding protein n=1 Tax=Kocuria coralli TaxID=1461025 RepID=A0A5J5KVR8_9MICC|nr:ABC transporter ATP-binding protein [Kocuria coralli]KAA9393674.1 ABC transporter ATP-binding protein [Kocuria coralli]
MSAREAPGAGAAAQLTQRQPRILPVATGRQTLAELWAAFRGRRVALAGILLLFALGAVMALVVPLLIGAIVDLIIAGRGQAVWWMIVLLGSAGVVTGVLAWLSAWGMARLVEPVLAGLRERFVSQVLRLPRQLVDSVGGGDVLSRATADVTELSENATSILPRLTSLVFTLVAVGLGLGALDWRYLAAALVVAPMVAWTMRWYLRTGPVTYAAERRALAGRARHVVDTFRAERTVRAYRLEDRQVAQVRDASWVHVGWAMRTRIVQNVLMARVSSTELAGLLVVLVVATWIALTTDTTAGALTAGVLLFLRIMDPVAEMLFIADDLQSAASALGRVVGVTRLGSAGNPERAVAAGGPGERGATSALVSLRGVRFAYDDGPEVLHGIDLDLHPGEHVALVGSTGSGKSTLAAIVSGLLGADSGRRSATVPDEAIGTVTQEDHVFAATLRENLTLAAPDAGDDHLLAVIDRLGAGALLADCPEGLDTVLGRQGHTLDPAASQQLALVRLALAGPQLAVLDEATAEAGSVDARRLEQTAAAAVRGRAALVVAHRLSQAAACDCILVLEGGTVVERGSHHELVSAGGRYAQLWRVWSRGE